ncbi:MAG: STAS domain-containing protein [Verrucomicrobiae bacterium]|nr:STAS domain-containing protein [Verrucomicrobiae bacterium]
MEIQEEKHGPLMIITLNGKLNAATYPQIHEHFNVLVNEGITSLLVDLAGVTYMSSVGLRLFFLAAKDLQRKNGKLVICSAQPDVRRLFEISGLPTPYPILGSREEALQRLASETPQ